MRINIRHDRDGLRRPVPLTWQIVILFASVSILLLLGISILIPVPAQIGKILDFADFLICMVFLVDFFLLLYLHNDRWRYFYTWGWLDLISSIPMVDALRWGRIPRLVRLLRLLRGLRGSAPLIKDLIFYKRETAMLAIVMTLLTVAVSSSAAVLIAEDGSGGQIDTAEKAIWWTFSTMTTVGYGDLVPTTTLGHVVGVITMFAGIGIFGTFTALVASFLVNLPGGNRTNPQQTQEIRERDELIGRLRYEIEVLRTGQAGTPISESEIIPLISTAGVNLKI